MDIENTDNKNLIGVAILLCLIVAVICFTYFAVNKKVEKKESTGTNIKGILANNEVESPVLSEMELDKLTKGFLKVLYNYSKSEQNGNFNAFMGTFDNNHKLFLGDILKNANTEVPVSFLDVKNSINNVLGTDMGVVGADYFVEGIENVVMAYNEIDETFTYNGEVGTINPSIIMGNVSIYNYKVKETLENNGEYLLNVYGLYKDSSEALEKLVNEKGLVRYIGVDNDLETYGYTETDEAYLSNLYQNDISQFVIFQYVYELKDNNFILKDFKVIG